MRNRNPLGLILLIALLLLSGCGRKEAPQLTSDAALKPSLNELSHRVIGNILELKFTISGMTEGVGFQIDRTEMDPYCQCPGFWRRYEQVEPHPKRVNVETTKIINLKTDKKEFLFRIRAYDAAGNLGPWSKTIVARAVNLFNK